MFFKRAAKISPPKPALGSIQTIPEIFYGGNDPEAGLQSNHKGIVKPSSVSAGTSADPASASHTRLVATAMIGIFVLVSGGAVWAYWNYLGGGSGPVVVENTTSVNSQESAPTSPTDTVPTTTPELATTTPEIIPVVTSTVAVNSAFELTELAADFPPINQLSSADSDSDTLTDLEEDVFGTDQAVFDTDADGYSDGQEVINLYNPKGVTPVRLVDSGLVREFTHPRDIYRLYYPLSWQAGSVDAIANTMLFTAANGDYLEVRIFTKKPNEDFSTWFGANAKEQQITDLQTMSNSFKTQYQKRKDGLVYYVDLPTQVLVIIYHPLINLPINYRTTLQLMVESLRVGS